MYSELIPEIEFFISSDLLIYCNEAVKLIKYLYNIAYEKNIFYKFHIIQ